MEELHAAIAAFLRSQRPAPPSVAPEPPLPSVRRQRVFACRFCAVRVWEGEHGAVFHFEELWDAVSCEACHRERLRREPTVGSRGLLLRRAGGQPAPIRPRCKRCGAVIGVGNARYTVEELQAIRECASCFMPA